MYQPITLEYLVTQHVNELPQTPPNSVSSGPRSPQTGE